MDQSPQNPKHHGIILVPQSAILGYAPSTSASASAVPIPSTNVSQPVQQEQDPTLNKKWWNDHNTKMLIREFKKHYEFWKSGRISKKKTMWQKVAQALNDKGLDCTADQVENRYKTLQRSYRKSRGILPRIKNSSRRFKYENELSDIFMHDVAFLNKNEIIDEIPPESIVVDVNHESSEEEPNTNYHLFEEESLEESPIATNTFYARRQIPRVKFRLPRKKPVKTSVDVLSEIKELMKKVELRRQIRHEQNLKVSMERNELLKRKNELMEQLLRKS